jgi:S-formylglutathione hydrolase FrmB
MRAFRRSPVPLLAALGLLLSAATASARDGAVRSLRMPAPSLGEASHSVRVYLPPSYDLPESRERRYPTLFLLHGWPGGDGNWPGEGRCAITLDSLSRRGEIPECVAVMPNGKGVGLLGRSLWLDSADGRSHLEDFLVRDLVAWTDSSFRTLADPEQRSVIGLSDGGTAAFNLVMRHPEDFRGAASLSGRFRLRRELGMNDALIGHGSDGERFLARNSPAVRADSTVAILGNARLYVDCGSDDADLDDNRAFHEQLTRLGVRHEYHEFGGGHGWGYWRTHLRDALLAVARAAPNGREFAQDLRPPAGE